MINKSIMEEALTIKRALEHARDGDFVEAANHYRKAAALVSHNVSLAEYYNNKAQTMESRI